MAIDGLAAPAILETAEACADDYITHSLADGVPPWDFQALRDSRKQVDASAAAITASGLLRLCRSISDPINSSLMP